MNENKDEVKDEIKDQFLNQNTDKPEESVNKTSDNFKFIRMLIITVIVIFVGFNLLSGACGLLLSLGH